ncbi:MAG: hypothetical protein ABEJ78_00265 [Haloferacaceae archaeon]
MSESGPTYVVYLTAATVADEPTVESPISTDHIDFYDSGVWVSRDVGRDFFPYERIRLIREGTDGTESGRNAAESTAAEPPATESTESSPTAGGETSDDNLEIE